MDVEGNGAGLPLRQGVFILGIEVETPELGAGCFAVAAEENGVVAREHGDSRFVEEDAAVVVAEQSDRQQVLEEVWHDVPGGGGELREEDVARGG